MNLDEVIPGSSQGTGERSRRDAASFLFWSGLVFAGMFINISLFSSLPLRLAQSDWQLQFTGTLLTAGTTALIGAVMMCTARAFDPSNNILAKRVGFIRRICAWVSIAYLILIPLQLYSGSRVLNQATTRDNLPLIEWRKLRARIEASSSEQELRTLLGKLRKPIELPATLGMPLDKFKQELISTGNAQFLAKENLDEKARIQRWQDFLLEAARNGIQSLLLAIGFAALGRGRHGTDSFLETVLKRLNLRRKQRSTR